MRTFWVPRVFSSTSREGKKDCLQKKKTCIMGIEPTLSCHTAIQGKLRVSISVSAFGEVVRGDNLNISRKANVQSYPWLVDATVSAENRHAFARQARRQTNRGYISPSTATKRLRFPPWVPARYPGKSALQHSRSTRCEPSHEPDM